MEVANWSEAQRYGGALVLQGNLELRQPSSDTPVRRPSTFHNGCIESREGDGRPCGILRSESPVRPYRRAQRTGPLNWWSQRLCELPSASHRRATDMCVPEVAELACATLPHRELDS